MKKLLISTLAVLALCALPGVSQAKDRGCGYRIASLDNARFELARAIRRGGDVKLAQAQLTRAKIKAAEEGCVTRTVVSKRVVKRRFDDRHDYRDRFDRRRDFDRDDRYRYRDDDRRYRDRDRDERYRIDRGRFDTLVKIKVVRTLSYDERRELDSLCDRWGWKY